MFEKLPNSEEAEQSVIGALLQDNSLIDRVFEILPAEDFYMAKHRSIFTAIRSVFEKMVPVDVVTVSDELNRQGELQQIGDLPYLTDLATNVPASANVVAYAKLVRDYAFKRKILGAATDITRYALDGSSRASEALEFVQSAVMKLDNPDKPTAEMTTVSQALDYTLKEIDRRYQLKGALDGLCCDLKAIDARVRGYQPGNLVIIAGRPGMAKTTVSLQMALNMWQQGKHGLFFTLEMSMDELMQKALACIGKIPLSLIQIPTDFLFDRYGEALQEAGKILRKCNGSFVDGTAMHINQIKSYARKAHKRKPLDFLFLDHLHIADGDGENKTQRISSISGGLKSLARELHTVVFALAQLNRGVEDRANKRPVLSDLRESGSIEQDADIIHFLYRDDYYKLDETVVDPNDGLIEVITSKFRNGVKGTDCFEHFLAQSRIQDTNRKPVYKEPPAQQVRKRLEAM